jgi:GalNAc-alpha-(1->4)-GalNAc-alpha-(1->3)-diNAcBac-PP-undecaprenol alpha-1,4-N-acetyl-D-galactosaminyltransferase
MPGKCIAFVITDMSGGGAARVASILCREWARAGHEVHLITFDAATASSAYPLAPEVRRHSVSAAASPSGAWGFIRTNFARVVRLRRILRGIKPDVAISFLLEGNVALALAARGLGLPVLISERNHPGYHKLPVLKGVVRAATYPLAHRLCVQTEDISQWFRSRLRIDPAVIPNPVETGSSPEARQPRSNGRRAVVGLGRLEPQKSYGLLIDAFAAVSADHPEWDLIIHGEGSERETLEARVRALSLENRVFLPGVTADSYGELRQADLFVHTARYEGYPNAVIEACSVGVCVIALDAPGATREILAGGELGMLVAGDDDAALSGALDLAMSDDALRQGYAGRAPSAVVRLSPSAIAQEWLDVAAASAR